MDSMILLDVIIPAYHAEETIDKCLASIAMQMCSENIFVTVVNDCDDRFDYLKCLATFEHMFGGMQVIRTDKNGGSGVARQYGLDHTSAPFIAFVDADDTYVNSYSLHYILEGMQDNDEIAVRSAAFIEECGFDKYVTHKKNMVWVFGKIYRRSYIEENNIRFHPTSRYNEDVGFNTIVNMLSDEKHIIEHIDDVVYCWHNNKNSITRMNNHDYTYNASLIGYAENMCYIADTIKCKLGVTNRLHQWIVQTMCRMYEFSIECYVHDRKYYEQSVNVCLRFYKEHYLPENVGENDLAGAYSLTMRDAYTTHKLDGVVPVITINEFLTLLHDRMDEMNESQHQS